MKELIIFAAGILAGASALFLLFSGWGRWPADKRKSASGSHHSHDASWLR